MTDVIPEARYLTDDRDKQRRMELVIGLGGNGDFYVAVAPEGEGTMGRFVRICTSGGCARANPRLLAAVADAYRAMTDGASNGQALVQAQVQAQAVEHATAALGRCEEPGCDAVVSHAPFQVCGWSGDSEAEGSDDSGTTIGCGKYFCDRHLIVGSEAAIKTELPSQLCPGCYAVWKESITS
jgi:hypothetical protein